MKIIFLGPPGSGKGTQGELLANKLNIPRLSVGAILRRHWQEKDKLGQEIDKYIVNGLNVPANILFQVLEPWFNEHRDGCIVDNLPRNLDQLEEFKKFLLRNNLKIDKVFHLQISELEIEKRIAKRRQERTASGNSRPDEEPQTVKKRIECYEKEIKPILDFFRDMGVLVEINGEQDIEKVHQEIINNLNI